MRTLAFLLILVIAALGAEAKTATLQGTTTNTCPFADTHVGDGGDLTVTCVTTPAPPQPPAGCTSSPLPVGSLNTAGFVNHMAAASPFVVVYALPNSSTGLGVLGLYSNPYTPKIGPVLTEISVSRCKGDFTDNQDGCYTSSNAQDGTQINQEWANRYTPRYPNAAAFARQHRCLTAAPGPWYINVRMSYPANACPGYAACGWDPIWKVLTL
jgi:hypothetical protein